LTAILIGIIVSIFFASFYPLIALVLMGFFIALGLILPLLAQLFIRAPGRRLISQRADIQSQLVDGIQGLADLLAFDQGAHRAQQIASTGKEYGSTQKQMARINGVHSALGTLLTNLGLWLVLVLVIPQVTAGNIKAVMLGTFTLMTLASFEAVTPLPLAAQMWNASREAAKRLFEVVDAEPAIKETGDKGLETNPSSSLQVSTLSFAYPTQKIPALQDISFTLDSGKSIAIVGPSGAGKSTLAGLALRFWNPTEGEISIGGCDIREYDQDDVRALIGVVSQDTHVFNDTLRANLLLARPEATDGELGTVLA